VVTYFGKLPTKGDTARRVFRTFLFIVNMGLTTGYMEDNYPYPDKKNRDKDIVNVDRAKEILKTFSGTLEIFKTDQALIKAPKLILLLPTFDFFCVASIIALDAIVTLDSVVLGYY
jgi:hypothetical protein